MVNICVVVNTLEVRLPQNKYNCIDKDESCCNFSRISKLYKYSIDQKNNTGLVQEIERDVQRMVVIIALIVQCLALIEMVLFVLSRLEIIF